MKRDKRGSRQEAGFTLMELLVVLAIIGLLAVLVAPRVIQYLGGAKVDTATVQIDRLAGVLDLYRLETESMGLRGDKARLGPVAESLLKIELNP